MSKKTQYIVLGIILLVGILLRGVHLFELPNAPDFEHPLLDHLYHDLWARNIAFGETDYPAGVPDPQFDRTPYFRPPAYPFFLAAIYKVAGTNPFIPRVIQMAIGILSCVLAYLLAKRWFQPGTALLTAGLMATSWLFIFYEGKLHSPFLLVFLALALIYTLTLLIDHFKVTRAILPGILFGLFALVRPNILTFGPVVVLWILWLGKRRGLMKTAFPMAGTFALAAILLIAPVTIRNKVVANDPVLISANGGINLFFGNNEVTRAGIAASHPDVGAWSCFDYPRIVDDLQNKTGQSMSYGEVSKYYSKRAWKFIREQPGKAFALTLKKTLLFWSPLEVSSYNDVGYERYQSKLLRNLPLQFSLTLALALVGLGMLLSNLLKHRNADTKRLPDDQRQRVEFLVLVLLFVGCYSATLILFIVSSRYRAPLVPFLLLGASYAISTFADLFNEKKTRPLVTWSCLLICVYLLANYNVMGYQARPDLWRQHRAMAHEQAGDWEKAAAELALAVQINPGNAEIHSNLGTALMKRGRLAEALSAYEEAVRLDPSLIEGHLGLGKMLALKGEVNRAKDEFHRAIEISPNHAESHLCLGSAQALQGREFEAQINFERAIELNRRYPDAHVCLGNLLLNQNKLVEAAAHFNHALEMDPQSVSAHLCLGLTKKRQGQMGKAKEHFIEALKIDPSSKEAQKELTALQLTP